LAPRTGLLARLFSGLAATAQRETADVGFLVEGEANGDRMPGLVFAGPGWW